jgi:DNA-binding NarL/FixJ family response regulator
MCGGRGVLELLSPSEQFVLKHIALGMTCKEIASLAGRIKSPKTIEAQRHTAMRKLNLHNTAQITRWAIKQGLVPLEDQSSLPPADD